MLNLTAFFAEAWNTVVTVFSMLNNLTAQKKFLQEHIKPIIEEAFAVNDGSLDQQDINKINNYYGLAVPGLIGEAFCSLHGHHMKADERWASTCQGAMTGLFDDFFDKDYLSEESILDIINHKNNNDAKQSNEKLFDAFFSKVLQFSDDPEKVRQTLAEVYLAQVESKKQVGNDISMAEITSITLFKGGSSLLFYRSVFGATLSVEEKELLSELGGLMQLSNDIFDVYKDREAKISTMATRATQIEDVRFYFSKNLEAVFKKAYRVGFPHQHIHRFLSLLSLGIFSRVFVCLDHLKKSERLTQNQFSLQKYSRKELICDMEKWNNKLSSAIYHYRIMKKYR
jgi:hypothetical protein